jgi:hypothetical protein
MTTNKAIKKDDVSVTVGSNLMRFKGERIRLLFEWLFDRFVQLGYKPHVLEAALTDGKVRRFRGINNARVEFRKQDWDKCDGMGLVYGEPHLRKSGGADSWTLSAGAGPHQRLRYYEPERRAPWLTAMWSANWSVFAEWGGLDEQEVIRQEIEFAKLSVDDYGYMFFMQRRFGATWYHDGMPYAYVSEANLRSDEQKSNIGAWSHSSEHFKQPLLRDVYPYNFLSRRYLELPVHGTTLRRWIEADPSRGTLEPLTDTITTWRPVIENIPLIRESLFRAGVMFYWRFYVQPSDTFLHMPGPRPFGPDESIPEIFRASFYSGLDPRLTV